MQTSRAGPSAASASRTSMMVAASRAATGPESMGGVAEEAGLAGEAGTSAG